MVDPLPGGIEVFLLNLLKEQNRNRSCESVLAVIQEADAEGSLRREYEQVARFYDLDCESFFSFEFVSKFRSLVRDERPDVVHAWGYDSGLVAGFLSRYFYGFKVVWAIHALDLPSRHVYHPLRFKILKAVVGLGSRFIPHRIISCSDAATDTHVRFGYPRRRCITIANGIDTGRFVPDASAAARFREEIKVPTDAPLVGILSRSHPVKDLVNFFTAVSLLMEERRDVHFVALGFMEEQLYPAARDAFRRVVDPGRLKIAGIRRDIEKCLPALTVNVLSSSSEALPMVLMEALACGVPCVATDVGSSRFVIGDAGLCVPPGDSRALADAVGQLIDSIRSEPEKWKIRAREQSLKHFSIGVAEKAHTRIYSALAGGG